MYVALFAEKYKLLFYKGEKHIALSVSYLILKLVSRHVWMLWEYSPLWECYQVMFATWFVEPQPEKPCLHLFHL